MHIYMISKILTLTLENQRRKKEPFEANFLWNPKKDCKSCFERGWMAFFKL